MLKSSKVQFGFICGVNLYNSVFSMDSDIVMYDSPPPVKPTTN